MSNAIDPRRVEYVPLDDLRADPRNPKDHDEEEINASIGRFGVLDLIVRDERTGMIVSGHGRFKAFSAMQLRGETPPEGVQVDDEGNWLVPVVTGWASRSDSEAAAALIALNRTTELGGWVDETLLELLEGLEDDDDGLLGVGYSQRDLDALRESMQHLDDEVQVPTSFTEYDDESIEIQHQCPSCGYSWSGSSKPRDDDDE